MYKNCLYCSLEACRTGVSILVLLDLCIKTQDFITNPITISTGFNPCFIGSMYKNPDNTLRAQYEFASFNPCFIGSMYKNRFQDQMCMKTVCFNPCFIGSMYKNK